MAEKTWIEAGQGVEYRHEGEYTVVRYKHTQDFGRPSPDKNIRVASSSGFTISSPGGVSGSLNVIKR